MPPPILPSHRARWDQTLSVIRQLPGTFGLVWEADRAGTAVLAVLTLSTALLPAAIAYVGKWVIDAVVLASQSGDAWHRQRVLTYVLIELGLVTVSTAAFRTSSFLRETLRASLGGLLNLRILEKALTLELSHFEDSTVYDKMQNARREANSRPLSLVMQSLSVIQNGLGLSAYAVLLTRFSFWSVLILLGASIPAFIAEARMSSESFRLNSWRAPEGRKLNYLEWILTRDSHVKEVKLYGLGRFILERYQKLFTEFFNQDRALARQRLKWGSALGWMSLVAFYGCYVWVAYSAALSRITLGQMTMYLVLFKQGQSAFQNILSSIGTMYEDALYMSNVFAFLDIPVARVVTGQGRLIPSYGALELRHVSFRYPGKKEWALHDVSLTLAPGEKLGLVGENGAGKSTLAKLIMRLYEPTEGSITYGGVDIREIPLEQLRSKIGAVFQDYVRYQFTAGENIGVGDVARIDAQDLIAQAAHAGGADEVIGGLAHGYDTVLGTWFEEGQELSAGQWQKLAVSRAYMRQAEILILDEPSASLDARAEEELFNRFQALSEGKMAIVTSHRFATVKKSDRIAVLHQGRMVELGSHQELLRENGRYAQLFNIQAKGLLEGFNTMFPK